MRANRPRSAGTATSPTLAHARTIALAAQKVVSSRTVNHSSTASITPASSQQDHPAPQEVGL
jgi:hypothetical protein